MKYNPKYALKHLSIRVPWHDNKWNGTICNNPKANGACLILKNCAENRNDEEEQRLCGRSIENLSQKEFPACVGERGTFMSPFGFRKTIRHPYSKWKKYEKTHSHFVETPMYFPPYSANCVPFNWMSRKSGNDRAHATSKATFYNLDYDAVEEENIVKGSNWIQDLKNQRAMLNGFFEHFEVGTSLAFFYAKQVPFFESRGRVLVGVGHINKINQSPEYNRSDPNGIRSCAWEHMVQHTIRQDSKNGFLLPYQEALEYSKTHPDFDPAELTVVTPLDKMVEFSYASEHVSNDTAIRTLLRCKLSIEKAKKLGIGAHHDKMLRWIHDEVLRLEKLRGDYPGMGAALCAFGIEKGHFVAAEITSKMEEGANPWQLFKEFIHGNTFILSKETATLVQHSNRKLYKLLLRNDPKRIELLHLLSRFELSKEQAAFLYVPEERASFDISFSDKEILENPYLLYEATLRTIDPIDFETIDIGLLLPHKDGDTKANLLPKSVNITDSLDARRIRALTIRQLENATQQGHTLLPRATLIKEIRDLPIQPSCPISGDYYELSEEIFTGAIEKTPMANDAPAYQLTRLAKMSRIIRKKVTKRLKSKRLPIQANWRAIIDNEFDKGKVVATDAKEEKARTEKAAALAELAQSRISVLIGSAGTGKTTLLSLLAQHEDIRGKVIFLAPTGKARVRIQEKVGNRVPAFTLAQFLNKLGRYDGHTQTYRLSDKYETAYETIILDEASMLTEEMLGTLLDSFKQVKRFILVGDYRQLPPIGAGRPFFDIIQFLKPEEIENKEVRVGRGYTELMQSNRQRGDDRKDIQLANWFSGNPLPPGEDSIFDDILKGDENDFLRVVSWTDDSDFEEILKQVLHKELDLEHAADRDGFDKSLGATNKFFNFKEAAKGIEAWQILSPERSKPHGVKTINRNIHKIFREKTVEYCSDYRSKLPQPLGMEEIVYGDKIINLHNQRRNKKNVSPDDGLNYIANGEMGILIGQWRKTKWGKKPKYVHVEFSTQIGYRYSFTKKEFPEDGEPPFELAYAITVHKSQGSEFGTVFLVVPNPCFLLKREMLYTALTRQKDRVVLLYQGDLMDLKKLSSPLYSDTYTRMTNLFQPPEMVEIEGKYLEKYLIHQAADSTLLRSKSELLIYQRLLDRDLEPAYEKELILNGERKIPDFTIEDDDTGEVFYWEHCGMLHDEEYRRRWEEKKVWYAANGILPFEDGGGENGTLIISEDKVVHIDGKTRGAISIMEVDKLIAEIFDV